jgi:hypothetical protein
MSRSRPSPLRSAGRRSISSARCTGRVVCRCHLLPKPSQSCRCRFSLLQAVQPRRQASSPRHPPPHLHWQPHSLHRADHILLVGAERLLTSHLLPPVGVRAEAAAHALPLTPCTATIVFITEVPLPKPPLS